MNEQILEAIDAEIARLQQAREILASALSPAPKTGRKKATKTKGHTQRTEPPGTQSHCRRSAQALGESEEREESRHGRQKRTFRRLEPVLHPAQAEGAA